MPPTYYRGCWHVVSRGLFCRYRHFLLPCLKRFTIRRPSSLTRRRWVRLSPIAQYSPLLPPVGVWTVSQFQCGRSTSQSGYNLSVRLPIVDLVGRYLTNYLMGRELIYARCYSLTSDSCNSNVSCGISSCFRLLSPSHRQIAHALLTRPPLSHFSRFPKD